MDFRDMPSWLLIFDERTKVIPFGSNATTVRALKRLGGHSEYFQGMSDLFRAWWYDGNYGIDESVRNA